MISEQDVINFYQYFYRKRFNSFNYKFKPSEKAEKVIKTFITLLDKHYNLKLVGHSFLYDFFMYQFNYWRDAKIEAFHGKFRIELIIGNKAVDRFNLNERDDHWVIEKSEIISLYGFKKSDLIPQEKPEEYQGSYEITIKNKNYNTPTGFFNCIENTTLYNHKHKCCMLCDFKADCKKVLKENFPKIYEQRGY